MTDNELLLYPLGDPTDRPLCAQCGAEMPLAKVEAAPNRTDYSTFRCPTCSYSETYIAEDAVHERNNAPTNPRTTDSHGR